MISSETWRGFGASVRRRRAELGYDVALVSEISGLGVETIATIEAGERVPRICDMLTLARSLSAIVWLRPHDGVDDVQLTGLERT